MSVDSVALPTSKVAGTEMEQLAPFYRDWRWAGTIQAGGMGPGSPEMSGIGRATCHLIQDGLWFASHLDTDQRLAGGTFVLSWRLHWVTGWDATAGEYRASSADNNGPTLAIYRGSLHGNELVYESLQEGFPRIRLTWILDDAAHAPRGNGTKLDGQ